VGRQGTADGGARAALPSTSSLRDPDRRAALFAFDDETAADR
jgi:hypothetical protein